ncbi:TonB-dependent siderophore receptor [Pararobbsia silviterrae]|uniref:TonB-dependent siderophore receptor n=1 Tax=Pararobbsia silviterrae TaxID=1792498 RepID=UPI0013146E38|nr:TonB-dependent receptor [Pararobbsia silviterrae]
MRWTLAGVSLAAASFGAYAQGNGVSVKHSYAIAAGALDDVLTRFASASGTEVSIDASLTRGKRSAGLAGEYTIQDGFAEIVRGQGLEVLRSADGVYSLRAANTPPAAGAAINDMTLPTVVVSDSAASDAEIARVNPPLTIGSKSPLAQRDIPNSVTVVTQQQLQSQNATTLDDAIKAVPGVTVNQFQNDLTAYYSRGFPIRTFQLDGVPTVIPSSGGGMSADGLIAYDRVEILRGPAGLFNGMGGDGGVIDLVRKRAPSTFEASAQVSVGTYADRREQVDIGGPLNAADTLRGRLVAMQHDEHEMQDGSWQRDQQLYGTLEADLTPTTLVRTGFSYSHISGHVPYGWPSYDDYSPVYPSRSAYLGASWDHQDIQTTNGFVSIEQQLSHGWTAKVAYNHTQYHSMLLNGIPGDYVDPATGIADLYSYSGHDNNTEDALDVFATGPFRLFGRTHHLTFGANYLHQSDQFTQAFINPDTGLDYWGDVYTNLYNNAAYSDAFAGGGGQDAKTVTNQYGVYGNARFSVTDPVTLIVGGRVTWWHSVLDPNADAYWNQYGDTHEDNRIGPKVTPFVGLVYDLNDTYSAYTSYTSIFVPQTSEYTVNGQIIKPVTGSQYEVGLKGEYLGGRLNTGVALFQVTEQNRAMTDPANPGYYVAQGKARSRGIELTASGEVLPGLTVSGGYTYTATQTFDQSVSVGSSFSVTTPKHLFKLWTDYHLPGVLNKWDIGATTYVTSGTYAADGTNRLPAPGYMTIDANIGYRITKTVSASLSVTNLLNRTYILTSAGAGGNYYGDPAKVLFTLRYAMQ